MSNEKEQIWAKGKKKKVFNMKANFPGYPVGKMLPAVSSLLILLIMGWIKRENAMLS